MDIRIVDDERLYSLELLHPTTNKPLGVTFKVRSMNSVAAKAMQRDLLNENLERRRANKWLNADDYVDSEYRKVAACVAGWDWGKNKYNGSVPEFTEANVLAILKDQEWVFSQVAEVANNLANFLITSKTN